MSLPNEQTQQKVRELEDRKQRLEEEIQERQNQILELDLEIFRLNIPQDETDWFNRLDFPIPTENEAFSNRMAEVESKMGVLEHRLSSMGEGNPGIVNHNHHYAYSASSFNTTSASVNATATAATASATTASSTAATTTTAGPVASFPANVNTHLPLQSSTSAVPLRKYVAVSNLDSLLSTYLQFSLPPRPRFRQKCRHRVCDRSRCGMTHKDQRELYASLIPKLPMRPRAR